MGSATVSQAGEDSTANCPGPSAQISAMATVPSYQTLGCAAVTPTGWDPTAPWVSAIVKLVQLRESDTSGKNGGCGFESWKEITADYPLSKHISRSQYG